MLHSPRPVFRSSLIRSLFDSGQRDETRSSRDTIEVDAEHDLEPDEPLHKTLDSVRDTIDVVPERDLLPDDGRSRPSVAQAEIDEHIVATHVDIAELGTPHHPLSSAPTTTDLAGARHRRGGGWLLAIGAALLLAPIVFGSRHPPEVAKPETAAAAAAPPAALPTESMSTTMGDEHELAIRFALVREPGDGLDAQRELALDPVYLTSPRPSTKPSTSRTKSAFDEGTALAAIRNAGLGSPQCGEGAAGATVVSVTFAPSGRVTRALVEDGPFRGTAVGGCIARHLRGVSIPPFDGDFRTVRTDVTLR
jgi:hypothetical protein